MRRSYVCGLRSGSGLNAGKRDSARCQISTGFLGSFGAALSFRRPTVSQGSSWAVLAPCPGIFPPARAEALFGPLCPPWGLPRWWCRYLIGAGWSPDRKRREKFSLSAASSSPAGLRSSGRWFRRCSGSPAPPWPRCRAVCSVSADRPGNCPPDLPATLCAALRGSWADLRQRAPISPARPRLCLFFLRKLCLIVLL